MGPLRPSRDGEPKPGWLRTRMLLFAVAAAFALAGMATGQGWMTLGAIVLLAAGLLLRFIPEK